MQYCRDLLTRKKGSSIAYLLDFTEQIKQALAESGIPIFAEFEHPRCPLPDDIFLTVQTQTLDYGEPVPTKTGALLPVSLVLRLRLHGGSDLPAAALESALTDRILPPVRTIGCDIRKITLDAPAFDKALNRMTRCLTLTICGVLNISQELEESD